MSEFSDTPHDLCGRRIWVAGHEGMVGAALVRQLQQENCEILGVSKADLDLRQQADVSVWMQRERPDIIVIAAAKVGGIGANAASSADFLYDNLMIASHIIHEASRQKGVRLLFLGSSCIYPKYAPQPIPEDALLSGPLEPTNEAYAIAKIAGLKLCQFYRQQYGCDFISAMPCNLYGKGDRYHAGNSHVIPAMLMKFHAAKMQQDPAVTLWSTGQALREFLYVDDLAGALIHLLKFYQGARHINVGSGREISIQDLAALVAETVGYQGKIVFDPSYPDGTPRKLMDNSVLHESGWRPKTDLREGLHRAYQDYLLRYEVLEGAPNAAAA
ncbi:MAG: GDP-L-fucose synthase [Rhodospirillales bacterium]|nr:GDP-L-fucose synthase [Rhodospirillales bacterium]MCB9964514.1 GDP-L-fucose synthase [Rhodospirillales bacterium]MCB9973787.1 GDP-L-fucose synthase [Rhodospirillales bacterium]MCB9980329.1 GDP-L-fucose synthase [Rhodospirillales bacterium]